MFAMTKTKLNLESCYFGFEGIRDQDDIRNEKKESYNVIW